MRYYYVRAAGIVILCVLLFAALVYVPGAFTQARETSVVVERNVPLRDNDALYRVQNNTEVVEMYLTVSMGSSAEGTNHTWVEVNEHPTAYYSYNGIERYRANALLQLGDENGPIAGKMGELTSQPNATVQIRGQSTSGNKQKSYKIELNENAGLWNDQRVINLNKHASEGLRFRNKLMYDIMSEVPQIMSLRTQFVHLHVKDLTSGETAFRDYGLYTHVEQLNKRGLRAHGWDEDGHLYKANTLFEFYRYEDIIKLKEDPGYDEAAFEYALEIKGNSNHAKLIEMLDALNDETISIEAILDKYFDMENLTYWLGFMILTGNIDTSAHNFYLYSPVVSDKWYLIPWDNDGAFLTYEKSLNGNVYGGDGVATYWGNYLIQRCLKLPAFRWALEDAITDLRENYLTEENLLAKAEAYGAVVRPYLERMPDAEFSSLNSEQYEAVSRNLPEQVEKNYKKYRASLKKPMPFFAGAPFLNEDRIGISWSKSYALDGQQITYIVQISEDANFNRITAQEDGIVGTRYLFANELRPGQYYIRVLAENEMGEVHSSFGSAQEFYVLEDGTIENVN